MRILDSRFFIVLPLFLVLFFAFISTNLYASIRVQAPLNSIPKSSDYQVFVADNRNGDFKASHVVVSRSKAPDKVPYTGFDYKPFLSGYRMSYTNIEFSNNALWVKVVVPNKNVPNFVLRPKSKGAEIFYEQENNRRIAKIKIKAPTNTWQKTSYIAAVPVINGKDDLSNALGIFANPFIQKPSNNIVNVYPGNAIPQAGGLSAGQTVYFRPGKHRIGNSYNLKNGVNYFLDNGAYVIGAIKQKASYSNVKIYGLGILSGSETKRYNGSKNNKLAISPINIFNCNNVTIEGITIDDSAHHSLNLGSTPRKVNDRNAVKKIKIITWRPEGDGVHIFQRGMLEDAFLRTQDDSMYTGGSQKDVQIRRVSTWNDYNGSSMIFTAGNTGANTTIEDIDVLYNRSQFSYTKNKDYTGGSVFSIRHNPKKPTLIQIENISFNKIRVEDKALSNSLFALLLDNHSNLNSNQYYFKGITFKNVTAAALGKEKNIFSGFPSDIRPQDISFDCVKVNNKNMTNLNGWATSRINVNQIAFTPCKNNSETSQPAPPTDFNGSEENSNNAAWTDKYWRIENNSSGGWLRPQDCSYDLATPLAQVSNTYTGGCTMFEFERTQGDHYFIKNRATGGKFMPQNCSYVANGNIEIVQVGEQASGWCAQWKLNKNNNGQYRLQNRQTGQYMRVNGCVNADNDSATIRQVSSNNTGSCTLWNLVRTGVNVNSNSKLSNNIAGKKRIKDGWQGRYIQSSSQANFSVVKSVPLNSNWNSQQWVFERVNGNNFRIKNIWTGDYLSVQTKYEWAEVQVSPLNKSWLSQQWLVEAVGNQYRIKNVWSKLYLHTPEKSESPMRQARLNLNYNSQKFSIEDL